MESDGAGINCFAIAYLITFFCYSMIVIMKKLGLKEYLADTWNLADILTLLLSFLAFALYIILKMSIIALQNQVS